MLVLKRPNNDNFTFRLFYNLTRSLTEQANVFYLWSPCIDPSFVFENNIERDIVFLNHNDKIDDSYEWKFTERIPRLSVNYIRENEFYYRNLIYENITKDLVVFGIKDHLTSGSFNPYQETEPNIVSYLKDLFSYYDTKQFLLFTSLENLNQYITSPNVTIIPWGGDITNQQREYPLVSPVLDKNLDSSYSFLSLNRNRRTNRCFGLYSIFGLNLESYGLVSCMFQNEIDIEYNFKDWPIRDDIRKIWNVGSSKAANFNFLIQDDWKIYKNSDNDNVTNFNSKLKNYYKDAFIEIVAETSFTEQSFNLTEKTLNSIYGCCFPIFLSSPGTVKFLRSMGLDMFDDIINHSYDLISDPVERAYTAINSNSSLILDIEKTKKLWVENKHRFLKNIDFVKGDMYKFYKTRTETMFKSWINTSYEQFN